MTIENQTPFSHFDSVALSPNGEFFRFCVVRGTFEINPDGVLEVSNSQPPPALEDEYYGDPTKSSLRIENDLAPIKPHAEIYFVDPVARPESGRPETSWDVSIRVGDLSCRLRAYGERSWYRSLLGAWKLTEPVASEHIPITFERAYGGADSHNAGKVIEENPVGVGGFFESDQKELIAPQIETFDSPIVAPGPGGKAVGLTPVHRGWLPRRALGGTFDADWKTKKFPLAPDDFSNAFFNCAPRELQYSGFLAGDEWVEFTGLGPADITRFQLPGRRKPVLLMLNQTGTVYKADFELDTVIFALENRLVTLLWRAAFSTPQPVDAERLIYSEV